MKIPNSSPRLDGPFLSLARIVSEDSQHVLIPAHYTNKSSKDS